MVAGGVSFRVSVIFYWQISSHSLAGTSSMYIFHGTMANCTLTNGIVTNGTMADGTVANCTVANGPYKLLRFTCPLITHGSRFETQIYRAVTSAIERDLNRPSAESRKAGRRLGNGLESCERKLYSNNQ